MIRIKFLLIEVCALLIALFIAGIFAAMGAGVDCVFFIGTIAFFFFGCCLSRACKW